MSIETPMMKQYHRIKQKHSDSILLFRLGDFYEMFEGDAAMASSILNIALTKRNNVPMCGFPHHAAESYIGKLIQNGKKIAICEQQEDPQLAKGIVKRDVVEIMSPGMITDQNLLSNKSNNCIAAVRLSMTKVGISLACASLDVSTGEFLSCSIREGDVLDSFRNEIENNGIREIIYPESYDSSDAFSSFLKEAGRSGLGVVLRKVSDLLFDPLRAEETLKGQFSIAHAGILELEDASQVVVCGALLGYVRENLKRELSHVRWVRERHSEKILFIDNATKKHLELTESQQDGSPQATLLGVLDRTLTAMGGRLLKKRILTPSRDMEEIARRLERVEYFFTRPSDLTAVRGFLSGILDVERIVSRLSVGKGNARDLVALKSSLCKMQEVKGVLMDSEAFQEQLDGIGGFKEVIGTIEKGIVEDPPLSTRDGGMIREGYDERLDGYHRVVRENRDWIVHYQADQQKKHGIPSLKVRYNKIIGYYIEVTKPNIHLVPGHYMKKQTLVNSERFTTEELTKHELLLNEARDNSNSLEAKIFDEIRELALSHMTDLYQASSSIAAIDVSCSLALAAAQNGYMRPEILEENTLDIRGGRHPVIEKIGDEQFIENDLELNATDRRIMILTGPNMSGKSTFLRQCALIIIMAHMGCFVPAASARIGMVDRVFSRIGMSDRLAKGESTFLVEMIETSRILHYATGRSFIIMDEIGRGTSTYDGLAIAWAVLEHLLSESIAGAKVLFATHYHEITALEDNEGVINYTATVKEWNNSVIFLRKIVPGSASRSYGVEVAKMAGIPDSIIERAKHILHGLETKYGSYVSLLMREESSGKGSQKTSEKPAPSGVEAGDNTFQLGLFPSPYEILLKELKNVDINTITPLEALNILDRLQKSLEI